MAARDFEDEQAYFLSRHRLHNRLLHGWGIICGLEIRPHPDPNCADRYVIVKPGIAIDCCGRELVVEEEKTVEVWKPPQGNKGNARDESESTLERQEFVLLIRYCEQEIEMVPPLYEDCDHDELQANRVREVANLVALPRWDVDEGCWPHRRHDEENKERPCRSCGDEPIDDRSCLEPECHCEQGVPLALVTHLRKSEERSVALEIRTDRRPELRTPPEYLTHIVGINWPHGGVVRLSHLVGSAMNGRLEIYFDRQLDTPPGVQIYDEDENGRLQAQSDEQGHEYEDNYALMGTGVNAYTFMAELHRQEDVHYSPEVLFDDSNPPGLLSDLCRAVFPLDDRVLTGDIRLDNAVIFVKLRCDFVLDCNGRPVDGDHLRGRRPTGNGHSGGTFESWFRVVDDLERPRRRQPSRRAEASQ
jgi:hypothetical protein